MHFHTPNEHCDLESSPFFVSTRREPLEPQGGISRRRAAVSSFGHSGTNAHIVVEEYRCPVQLSVAGQSQESLILLSARTPEQLWVLAHGLREHLGADPHADLRAIAYTLQSGRQEFEHRAAFVAGSVADLSARLEEYLREPSRPTRVAVLQSAIDAALTASDLQTLAGFWLQGAHIGWEKLCGDTPPRPVSLPTYPFAKERYWIETTSASRSVTTTFTGAEPFLADHHVDGVRIAPAVVLLELALAAARHVVEGEAAGRSLILEHASWTRPLVVNGPTSITVHLQADGADRWWFEIHGDTTSGSHPYAHGCARLVPQTAAPPRIDLLELRARYEFTIQGEDCYAILERAGLRYGPGLRALRRLRTTRDDRTSALAWLTATQESPDSAGFALHPAILDSALHAVTGLMRHGARGHALPFALDRLAVFLPIPSRARAWLRIQPASDADSGIVKVDVDLTDTDGRVCAQLTGLTLRKTETPGGADTFVVPSWVRESPATVARAWPSPSARLLVIGADEPQFAELRRTYPFCVLAPASADTHAQNLDSILRAPGDFEHVLWITPKAEVSSVTDEAHVASQEQGALAGLRLIKALLRHGYGERKLGFTVITWQCVSVARNERNHPAHAAVHGLIGSLSKEYEHWQVRLLDLPLEQAWSVEECLCMPALSSGDAWAHRDRAWFRQHTHQAPAPVEDLQAQKSASQGGPAGFRRAGVYVLIGGAGGIGEVLSEYLIRTYDARIVWAGRRAADATIAAKIDKLRALGRAPEYLCADARKIADLEHLRDYVRSRYERIDGLIHASAVLSDAGLVNMTDAQFLSAATAKVDVCVRLAQAFQGCEPGFMLFLSSLASLGKAAGQANYSAGCAFVDAFAARLRQEWSCPVKVMNWGYWGSTGIAASPRYRARMEEAGIGSIEPSTAMSALEVLMRGPHDQLGFLRVRQAEPPTVASAPPPPPRSEASATLLDALRGIVGNALKLQPQRIEALRPLEEYGLDSIRVVRLAQQLRAGFPDLASSILFECRTLDSLCRHLLETRPEEASQWLRNRESARIVDVEALERFKRGELAVEEIERMLDEGRVA